MITEVKRNRVLSIKVSTRFLNSANGAVLMPALKVIQNQNISPEESALWEMGNRRRQFSTEIESSASYFLAYSWHRRVFQIAIDNLVLRNGQWLLS